MLFMMRFQILQGHGMHGLLRDSFPVSRFLSKDDDVSGQPNSDGESLATDQNIPNALESCLQPLGDSTGDCIGTNNEGKIRNGYGENLRIYSSWMKSVRNLPCKVSALVYSGTERQNGKQLALHSTKNMKIILDISLKC